MTRAVYVIRSDSGPIKIGMTGNVTRRLAGLQVSNPSRLTLHHAIVVDGLVADRVEALALAKLATNRLSGEWFNCTPEEAVTAVRDAALELGLPIVPWSPPPPAVREPRVPSAAVIETLKGAGRAMFGNQWQTPLATTLGVSDRTMRRWVAGKARVPDEIIPSLEQAARERVADIYAFMADLTATSAKSS